MTKKSKYIIIGAITLVLVVGFFIYRSKQSAVPQYETVKVERGNLEQTVEATGKVESATDLALKFEIGGIVDAANVQEGDIVKVGTMLANLRLAELNAGVAQASANLNQKLVGLSDADKKYYQAAVDSARSAYEQSKTDAEASVTAAQAVVDTAQNNLKLVEGGDNNQIVDSAYAGAVASLQTALSNIENGLTQSDNILGIDNTLGNDSFESYLSVLDSSKLSFAKTAYAVARQGRDNVKNKILVLTTVSAHADIDAALLLAEDALAKDISLLALVGDVLNFTPPLGALTQTILDGHKTTIDATRTAVNTQYTNTIAKKQALLDAKNSYSTYLVAYDKAVKDLATAKANAINSVAYKQAAYDQAQANYDSKINPPREVDVAALRAALSSAVASRDKAIIRAPIAGIVTKINKKKGEFITGADTMIQLLAPNYQIEVDIPETDISKLQLNDNAEITLDAFGNDVKFSGKIINLEPASTVIQDVVYYKVTVTLDASDNIMGTAAVPFVGTKAVKAGMTANVKITTDKKENVLFVPSRAIKSNGEKKVKVLNNGEVSEVTVEIGLKADGGKTEILLGLSDGQDVVVSVKAP
ncbi:MAG: hypothetical protein A3J93_00790 [Candidatus Magasanikbacteria bacterium RIFOXYC2_FULL_42_28]|uniref:Multidrug resistance protein MdtA-like C-terminal permuted SH3 domain-containing protein n=1 Tax=Candidatus Magasanikbacteria bacterium RIFOXYC2_FULL_42_28 TaxID=1798704 RepID=A0A1F6NXS2_9BACT|nr:MAG: hypothetical protein A3J93_00790 [Candidatus Magasanikbacteria bacterium RIFOXYC2_FULL_42_28]